MVAIENFHLPRAVLSVIAAVILAPLFLLARGGMLYLGLRRLFSIHK